MNGKLAAIMITAFSVNLVSYLSIREIIWSIYWLKKGGKLRKLKRISKDENLIGRINMGYISRYISPYKKEYNFWYNIKTVFVCCELFVSVVYVVLFAFLSEYGFIGSKILNAVYLFQAFVWFVILRFQFGAGGHLTKYDVKRMKKKK